MSQDTPFRPPLPAGLSPANSPPTAASGPQAQTPPGTMPGGPQAPIQPGVAPSGPQAPAEPVSLPGGPQAPPGTMPGGPQAPAQSPSASVLSGTRKLIKPKASQLLPSERAALEKLGWKEGDPVPDNLPEILRTGKGPGAEDPQESVVLPSSSGEEQVPLEAAAIEEAKSALHAAQEGWGASEKIVTHDPSVDKALDVARGMASPDIEIDDDISPRTENEQAQTTATDTESAAAAAEAPSAETGEAAEEKQCPHCGWDLKLRDGLEVTKEDKQRFLQALLGQNPFQKQFQLFDGSLSVILRGLALQELDACFEQVFIERKQGKHQSPDDYVEILKRFILSLQLVRLESTSGVNYRFPQSLDAWREFLGVAPEDQANTNSALVRRIYDYVSDNVIKSESLNRVLGSISDEFQRLKMKLEANAANPNFW